MINPYQSPQTPLQPPDSPFTGRAVAMFLAGFLVTMMLTIGGTVVSLACASALASVVPEPLAVIVFFMGSPAVIGPLCSVIVWRITRNSNRPYAIGAITFGVAAFLLFGGCLLAISM